MTIVYCLQSQYSILLPDLMGRDLPNPPIYVFYTFEGASQLATEMYGDEIQWTKFGDTGINHSECWLSPWKEQPPLKARFVIYSYEVDKHPDAK